MNSISLIILILFIVSVIGEWARFDEKDIIHTGNIPYRAPDPELGRRLAQFNQSTTQMNAWELGACQEPPSSRARSATSEIRYRWPNKKVPYVITNDFTAAQIATIQEAFNHFHTYTCVRFVPRTNEPDYLQIKGNEDGCWAVVGRVGGLQNLNLQPNGCLGRYYTAVHELMHTLGFWHEQSDSNRDNYVIIKYQNMDAGVAHNFDKKTAASTTNFGYPYDYTSCMHYSGMAFSNNGKPTIVAKKCGVYFGNDGLSAIDKARVNAMYEC